MVNFFVIGAIVYAVSVSISYMPSIKNSPFYFPLGLGVVVVANILWLVIAKRLTDSSKIMLYGYYWDAMTTILYATIPVLFFGARASGWTLIGLVLIFVGTIITMIK